MSVDKFQEVMKEAFGIQLAEEFQPCAIYYDGMDYVEYTTTNESVIADRIDKFLTILFDHKDRNLVGFRIKGFRYLFNEHLKAVCDLVDEDFIPLVEIIRTVIGELGSELLVDEQRRNAYKKVYKLAQSKSANLYDFPLQKAA